MRIAVDPGGHIGVAIRYDDGAIATFMTQNPEMLYVTLAYTTYEVVICEDFIAQHIDNYMRHTIRLVGAVQALAWSTKSPLAVQTPQTRKGFVKRAKTFLDLQKQKYVIHEVDALAHLLAWEALNLSKPKVDGVRS